MSLNKKPIMDLSEEELQKLAKPIGVPGLPYPTFSYALDANGDCTEDWRIIEDMNDPMVMYSTLSFERVLGDMFRTMPVPSMLNLMSEGLFRRRPEHKNKLMFLMGDAGFGKSFFAKQFGRMRDERGPIFFDCGKRNLNDILYETTIDYGETLRTAIDNHLERKSMPEARLSLLRWGLGEALIATKNEKTGKTFCRIEWDEVGLKGSDNDDKNAPPIDSHGLSQRALNALEKFCKLEGIAVDQASSLGLKMREGDLIRAFKEGREIVLDEYNKSNEGSDGGLQRVLQFLNGEEDEATVENSLKVNGQLETFRFTFKRSEMPIGFFCTLTGNDTSDGTSTRELSISANSRIEPLMIGDPKDFDWEHRISQMLTGLPITTLYRIHMLTADEDPKDFAKQLIALRKLGLSQEEIAAIPGRQFAMLQNWKKTVDATQMLAKFYTHWKDVIDPESELYQSNSKDAALSKIADEIEDGYKNKIVVDFRRIIKNIESSMHLKPELKAISDANKFSIAEACRNAKSIEAHISDKKDVTTVLGSNLSKTIIQTIGETTAGKPNLRTYLLNLAGNFGIIEPNLKGGKRSKMDLLKDLLNMDPYEHVGGDLSLRNMRTLIANYMRAANEDIKISANDIPLSSVAAAVESVMEKTPELMAGWSYALPVIGTARSDGELIEYVGIVDQASSPEQDSNIASLTRSDVFVSTFLFKIDKMQASKVLWDMTDWKQTAERIVNGNKTLVKDKSIAYANNSHENGIRMTTLLLRDPKTNEAVSSHVFIAPENNNGDKILIVTDGIADSIKRHLQKSNITIANKSVKEDIEKVDTWLNATFAGGAELSIEQREDIKTAMSLRNDVTENDDYRNVSEILMDKNLKPLAPVLIKSR